MKKLLLLVFTVCLAVACDKDNNQQNSVLNGAAVSIRDAVIPPVGGDVSFAVTTDAPWKVYDKPDWLNLSPSEGRAGTTPVEMSADINRSNQDRACTLRFETSSGSFSETVSVSQEHPYIELSRSEIAFDWNHCETLDSEVETIDVHSNVDWSLAPVVPNMVEVREKAEKAEIAAARGSMPSADLTLFSAALREASESLDWLSFSPVSGSGDGQLSFCPKTYNISREPRTMEIDLVGPLETYKLNFSQANLRFEVNTEAIEAFDAAYPEAVTVQVDAERPWTLSSAPAWIKVSPTDGVDITDVTITADGANPTREDRSGQIVLLCEEVVERVIDVAQRGYVLDVSAEAFSLANKDTEPRNITVTSSGAWEVRNVPDWIVLSANSGEGHGEAEAITLQAADQNLSLEDRNASIVFASTQNSLSHSVDVSQDAFIFTASIENATLPTLSTSPYKLSIQSSGPWTAASSESWLDVSQKSGTGDAEITYQAKSGNTDENPRVATITLTSTLNNVTREFWITQKGYVFTVTPQSYSYPTLPAASNYCRVKIECSSDWTISAKPDWITASADRGIGDAEVTLSAANNLLLEQRTGKVSFSSIYNGANKVLNVTVSQDRFIFEVSESSFDVPTIVTTPYVVSVNCSSSWDVQNLPNWIGVKQSVQSGNGSATFTVESNPELSARSATVHVNSRLSGHVHEILFSQAAFEFDSSPVSYAYDAVDGTKNLLQVVCSGDWSFVGVPGWVTLSPATGSGNTQVRVGVSNNVETTPRNANFVMRSGLNGLERQISIAQKAFVFDNTPENFAYEALNTTSTPVSVVCMGGWTVQNAEPWMNVTPTSGTGNGSITISPAYNTTKSARSGVVRVVSTLNPNLSKNITVSQKAFEFDETAASYSYEALSPGSTRVQISGMGDWTVQNIPDWVSVSPISGSGDEVITISPKQNLETRMREVTLYVTSSLNESIRKPITLKQEAFRFDETAEHLSFDALDPARRQVSIACMGEWNVSGDPEWVSVSPMSGANDGMISIEVTENIQPTIRTATIQVSSSLNLNLIKRIEISQDAFQFDTEDESFSFKPMNSGSIVLQFSGIGAWQVVDVPDWARVTPAGGSGNGQITIAVEDNIQPSSRTATLHIVSSENPALQKSVTLYQEAYQFVVSPSDVSLPAALSEPVDIQVTCSGGTWSVECDADWLTVSPQTGTASGVFSVEANAANQTGTERTASVRVICSQNSTLTQSVQIRQSAN